MMGTQTSKNRPRDTNIPKYELNNFAVITVLFNPIKYKSRYELYHKFDEHMTQSGVTLLTVECIYDCNDELGLPQQKFEITRANDPRHLQIKAPSILWLKENLINIAAKRLPSYIEYIAWLDADIEFEVCLLAFFFHMYVLLLKFLAFRLATFSNKSITTFSHCTIISTIIFLRTIR